MSAVFIDTVIIYKPIDLRLDGVTLESAPVEFEASRNGTTFFEDLDSDVTIEFKPDGSVELTGIVEGAVVEYVGETEFHASNIDYLSGKYDIGFVGNSEVDQAPDALFEFQVQIEDYDEDTDLSNVFEVVVDGTGIFADLIYDPDPTLL
jgi:hypothetical protein